MTPGQRNQVGNGVRADEAISLILKHLIISRLLLHSPHTTAQCSSQWRGRLLFGQPII